MMRFATLLKHPADWMTGHGEETSVVLTSRVRLARNLSKSPFPGWSRKKDREGVYLSLREKLESVPGMKDGFSHELCDLDPLQKQVLVERHLISREQAARSEGSGSVVNRKQTLSLMINEEDHLRIQAIHPSLQLKDAFKLAHAVDQRLEKVVDFAIDPTLGYLTACPTNLGTGMRASSMLHLPGLVLSDQIGPVLKGINKLGLAVRGLYGEGTESLGNLFQISNQSTLGESEGEILDRLTKVISDVALYELQARKKLMTEDSIMVRDRIGRAAGNLSYAHIITSKEALNHLSMLRLGADLTLLPADLVESCDRLFMETQPAHLQWRAGRKLEPEARDMIRAQMIREQLQSSLPPAIDLSGKES